MRALTFTAAATVTVSVPSAATEVEIVYAPPGLPSTLTANVRTSSASTIAGVPARAAVARATDRASSPSTHTTRPPPESLRHQCTSFGCTYEASSPRLVAFVLLHGGS